MSKADNDIGRQDAADDDPNPLELRKSRIEHTDSCDR